MSAIKVIVNLKLIKRSLLVWLLSQLMLSTISCKKLIEIPPPVSTITTAQVFSSDGQANSALAGIYSNMINSTNLNFGNGIITVCTGLSSDELNTFLPSISSQYIQFQNNTLLSSTGRVYNNFWVPAYSYIYGANSILEGLSTSTGVHTATKNELIGEAKFIRAFCYFYLTNLFGDVPLITSTDWMKTNLLNRSPSSVIYQQILADLKDAQLLLPNDYSVSGGERLRPNKWAATALLARVYLYMGNNWSDAETQADSVINNSSVYSLVTDPNGVFLSKSTEAIWQLQQNNTRVPFNATQEGKNLVPINSSTQPFAFLTGQMLNAFETGDKRKAAWIDSTLYRGKTYYYPYKYKMGVAQATVNGTYSEYYMVLRLGEQYLIRSEARAHLNDLGGAIADLNSIRSRAGIPNLSTSLTQDQVFAAIAQERRVELFAEWGHRWLDLKRTQQATIVLKPLKQQWTNNVMLYPIPLQELTVDPNLTQNAGY